MVKIDIHSPYSDAIDTYGKLKVGMFGAKQSLEIQYNKEDWKRYQEFLQSWGESSLDESDWIYRKVKQRSLRTCKRYNMEDRLEDIFRLSLNTIAQEHFEKGRSLDSYLNRVVTEKIKNLKKKAQKEEISKVIHTSEESIVHEIFRRMNSERNMRRLLSTRPSLQREIITTIINLEHENRDHNFPQQEIVRRWTEDVPDLSIQTAKTMYENLKETIRKIEIAGESYKKKFVIREENKILLEIAKLSSDTERQKYEELYGKFEEGTISDGEREELLKLNDHLEIIEAKRLELLSKLADIRGVPLKKVVEEFADRVRFVTPHPSSSSEIRVT